ncbi:EamA family transporter [Williamsia sterculiae]|uniref:EamA family transporter n=1 Tax=Williamsia sterculiae TaxID=1344003 RepID=UPI001F46A359|nr:EamA family transporter [Williamsia sterculiae]
MRSGFVPVLFIVGAVCQYGGAALAIPLFANWDPVSVAWLRCLAAGVVLVTALRPRGVDRSRLLRATIFGLTTLAMNGAFYLAIDRIPLGVAVAVEFVGPVAVAILGSRRLADVAAAVTVLVGVVLVSGASLSGEWVGVVWALAAAAMWAGYVVIGKRISDRSASGADTDADRPRPWRRGVEDLGIGLTVASLLLIPLIVVLRVVDVQSVSRTGGGPVAWWHLVALGIAVGVLSSAVPYVLDQVSLLFLGRARFALLLALLPVTAALVGAVTLGQLGDLREWLGIVMVCAAIALTALNDARRSPARKYPPGDGIADPPA